MHSRRQEKLFSRCNKQSCKVVIKSIYTVHRILVKLICLACFPFFFLFFSLFSLFFLLFHLSFLLSFCLPFFCDFLFFLAFFLYFFLPSFFFLFSFIFLSLSFFPSLFLFFKYFFGRFFSFCSYNIQHCFICRPSDSTVPTDAGIEPRTVATNH
jgi:hypothetical protein